MQLVEKTCLTEKILEKLERNKRKEKERWLF
jgi:hypothetical protein